MRTLQWALIFVIAAAVLVKAAAALARAGDEIATRTGLGGLLIGSVLVAAATSLPEVTTDVSAALAGAPDLAVGDLFGSSMANMAILALLDLMHHRRVWPAAEIGHARLASVAIALTAFAVLAILTPPGIAIGWVGLDTVVIAATYATVVLWMRRGHISERASIPAGELPVAVGWTKPKKGRLPSPVRPAVIRFALAAAAVFVTAPMVAISGKGIAEGAGISATFVGVALLAMATSLPELMTSVAAARMGAYDLAVGNLFGSNAMNVSILFLVDIAYTEGPVLAALEARAVMAAGVGAIVLMAIALAAIVHGEETRIGRLEPDAIVLLWAYIGGLFAVWMAAG